MTNSAVVQKSWINGHPEEFKEVCPFDLVPGSNGRWLLWWPEEKTWIASFPSLEAAYRVMIGTNDWHLQPGTDRSTFPLDLKVALKRQQKKTGRLPQFELSEDSNIFDLYVPLGLGIEAFARLSHWEVETCHLDQRMIDNYYSLVAQCLSESKWRLTPDTIAQMAPIVSELLLRQTRAQNRMNEESRTWRQSIRKLKVSKVRRMTKERLLHVECEYDLDIDVDKFSTLKDKRNAVIKELAALGLLKE
jgi:hypothetical protein